MSMKYALVTGSSRGIGYAIAERLVQDGYFVFINGRSNDPGAALPPGTYSYVKADMSAMDGVTALADAVMAKTRSLDCLVLCAGATCRKPLRDIGYPDWQYVMDTNVNMPFFLIQRLFSHMAPAGSVVLISSAMSHKPHATSVPYGVSKAAQNMLGQTLVKELAPRGIRINVICPGFIDTQWQKEKPDEHRKSITGKIALGRFGTPEEIADMCSSLIKNTHINGALVNVDGGYDFV